MARRATRLSPKALLRLRKKLIDEGLYKEDRPEDTIGNRIRPISDSLVSIKNPDELATRVKTVLTEGPVVPIPGSFYNIGGTYSCSVGEILNKLISKSTLKKK